MPSPRITGQFIYPSSPTPVWGHNKIMDSITLLSAAGKVAADAYFENKIHYSPASSYAEATARQVGCRGTRVSLLLWPSAREADSNKEGGQRTNSFLPDGGGGLHTSIAEWARQSCPQQRICEVACLEVPVPSSVGYSTKEKTPRPGGGGLGVNFTELIARSLEDITAIPHVNPQSSDWPLSAPPSGHDQPDVGDQDVGSVGGGKRTGCRNVSTR